MSVVYACQIPSPKDIFIHDEAVQVVSWQGQEALRLSGAGASLVLVPDLPLAHGKIEVDIGCEGPAYAGIVFRAADTQNFELVYAQPHTSGKWDALQYDPVFHGSNTWQLYHGTGAQQVAQVPPQTWFRLRVEFFVQQALVQAGDQPPLLINRLAHDQPSGLVGLWTYLPAHFANLCIWDDQPDWSASGLPVAPGEPAPGTLMAWFLEGFGVVACEPSGILNLNRYLPVTVDQVRLVRQVELLENGSLTIDLGFSDEMSLQVDEQALFTGQHTWHDSPHWSERGYVNLDHQVRCELPRGVHRLEAVLRRTEYFGFGMVLRVSGVACRLLPAQLWG